MPRVLQASCVLTLALLAACVGGPHPLPPNESLGEPVGTPGVGVPTPSTPTSPASGPSGMNPASVAGTGATAAPQRPAADGGAAPMMPPAPATGAAGRGASAAGAAAPPPATPPGAGAAGSGAMPAENPDGGEVCDGPTGALSASSAAPANLLFVLDRSVEMATVFQGAQRWELAVQSIERSLGTRANSVMMGALLYPSASSAACTDPMCAMQAPMCTVNAMAAVDQVSFQPASAALSTLRVDGGLYAPVMASSGVPLLQSLEQADTALANSGLSGRTAVVILASGAPSCSWDSTVAGAMIARWRLTGVQTHVVALPGSPAVTPQSLSGLAQAGGSEQVHAPKTTGALEAALQSIVFDSLSSCTLQLDAPAPDPAAVQVLVTEDGAERVLPRTSATGETSWTLSPDGRTVTLVGTACEAASNGTYEAVRVVLGC